MALRVQWVISHRKTLLVQHLVWHLVKDLKKFELASVLSAASGHNTWIWDYKTKSSCPGTSLPWAINYLLGHHRKHIFRLTAPRIGPITSCLDQWKQRLPWRHHFEQAAAYEDRYGSGDTDREDTGVDMVQFRSRLHVQTCYEECVDLRPELDEVVETMTLATHEALRIYSQNTKKYSNTSKMIKYALKRWKNQILPLSPPTKMVAWSFSQGWTIC